MISTVQALYVHDRLIERTGGRHGIRDLALLESALARPYAVFDGRDLYPDAFTRAAALMSGIIKNHPFIDGNKRTGIVLGALYLEQQGWSLTADDDEVVGFTNRVAEGQLEVETIAEWFRRNTRKGPRPKGRIF